MPNKSPKKNTSLDYKSSGVDVEAGYQLVNSIKPFVEKTKRKEIMSGLGSFSAMSKLPSNIKDPVLVTCTDGVGTKIEIARKMNNFGSIGKDLVAMCVNDLVTCGAEPFLFLDYYVTDSLKVKTAASVIEGIAKGCEEANCSLVGGETAEHPNSFPENSFDLAGFAVGAVDEKKIIGKNGCIAGDYLIGIESSGVHSNGFSLIRKLIEDKNIPLSASLGNMSLGEVLLIPTKIYVKQILELAKKIEIQSISHITGGGFFENIPRMMANETEIKIKFNFNDWPSKHIFKWIQSEGDVSDHNMLSTFNCGIGMVIAVKEKDIHAASSLLNSMNLTNKVLGEVSKNKGNKASIEIV